MDADTTPPPRPLSAEFTPVEYDYYLRRAQQIRSDAIHEAFWNAIARFGRLFVRAKAAPRREPVLVESLQSRTA